MLSNISTSGGRDLVVDSLPAMYWN